MNPLKSLGNAVSGNFKALISSSNKVEEATETETVTEKATTIYHEKKQSSNVEYVYVDKRYSSSNLKDKVLVEDGYATNADVYAIISSLANKASEIPAHIWRRNFRGEYEIDDRSEAYRLLHGDPDESYKQKIIKAMININATGDVYFEKIESAGQSLPSRLKVLQSASVDPVYNSQGTIAYVNYTYDGKYRKIMYEDLIHVKLYDPTCNARQEGMSPLRAGYNVLSASNDLQVASSAMYKNQGSNSLLSDNSGKMRDSTEAKRVQNELNKKIGGARNAGKVTVTSADVKLLNLGMSARDMELIKSHPIKLRQLCNVFGTDSSFYNDPENSTYNNRKEAEKATINNGVKPKLELIINTIEHSINQVDDVEIRLDYSVLDCLQENQKERAEKNKIVTDALRDLLQSDLTPEQKAFILEKTWGYTEEEAQILAS